MTYTFTKVGNLFIVAQDQDDPERVIFYWKFTDPLDHALYALTRACAGEFPPNLKRQITLDNGNVAVEEWFGAYWDDQMDDLLKSLAEAFIDLRFASPDRTQIHIQSEIWPEGIDVG